MLVKHQALCLFGQSSCLIVLPQKEESVEIISPPYTSITTTMSSLREGEPLSSVFSVIQGVGGPEE